MVRLARPVLVDAASLAHAAENHGDDGGLHRPAQQLAETPVHLGDHELRPEALSLRTVGHDPRHHLGHG